jgi:hypothetical protein
MITGKLSEDAPQMFSNAEELAALFWLGTRW